MNTAVANTDQWELVKCAEKADPAAARAGREWPEKLSAGVHHDGSRLTPN